MMLKVEKLDVYYGNIHALKEVSFEVQEGEIVTLIGANGAGKTTTLHALSGLIPIRAGSMEFCGTDLQTLSPHKIVQLGLGQVPEGDGFCESDRHGKSRDGGLHAERPHSCERITNRSYPFSAPERKGKTDCRNLERR